VFATLAAGGLAAGQFVIGTIVQDASDRIIYTSATGAGGTVAIQFADMTPVLALTNLERARSNVLKHDEFRLEHILSFGNSWRILGA
jgi:hypothetical protein